MAEANLMETNKLQGFFQEDRRYLIQNQIEQLLSSKVSSKTKIGQHLQTVMDCLRICEQQEKLEQTSPTLGMEQSSVVSDRNNKDCKHLMLQLRNRLSIGLAVEQTALFDDDVEVKSKDLDVLSTGCFELQLKICILVVNRIIAFLLSTIELLPEWVQHWNRQLKRNVLIVALEAGPIEWFQPRSQRIQLNERVRILNKVLDSHFNRLGCLKKLLTKLQQAALDQRYLANTAYHNSIEKTINFSYDTIFKILDPEICQASKNSDAVCESIDCNKHDPLGSNLYVLLDKLIYIESIQGSYADSFLNALHGCEQPTHLRRKWLQCTVSAVGIIGCTIYFIRNREHLERLRSHIVLTIKEFFMEHMILPLHAIISEMIFNKKPVIQDAAALLDTKRSLQRMLNQFLNDTQPNMDRVEKQRVLDEMDMSVVSLQFEKEIPKAMRNILSGDIIRMLLIQVQFIKKELLITMGMVDELMIANQISMQMLATIPTFIVLALVAKLVEKVSAQIFALTSKQFLNPLNVYQDLQCILRDIERLLNRRNVSDYDANRLRISPSASPSFRSNNSNLEADMLNDRDLGSLLLLLHRLRHVFDKHRRLFRDDEQQRFQQDLNDLLDENMLISQQLATIYRMTRTHEFLALNPKNYNYRLFPKRKILAWL